MRRVLKRTLDGPGNTLYQNRGRHDRLSSRFTPHWEVPRKMVIVHSQYHESGTATIDESSCEPCGQCAATCPTEALRMVDGHVRFDAETPRRA